MAGSFIITVRAQDLYDATSIQEIKIYFPYTNWDQKLDSLHSADSDARLVCSYILLNGQKMDSVGIRYKGNSTYNATRNKNPFNIKLDHVKSDQNYQGYTTIKLSNCFMDPSMLREVMGYYISRQYIPASQSNFMKVYVNDSYIGLYTNVEAVSSDFCPGNFIHLMAHFFNVTERISKLPFLAVVSLPIQGLHCATAHLTLPVTTIPTNCSRTTVGLRY